MNDINDNSPEFPDCGTYAPEVSEDASDQTFVIKVSFFFTFIPSPSHNNICKCYFFYRLCQISFQLKKKRWNHEPLSIYRLQQRMRTKVKTQRSSTASSVPISRSPSTKIPAISIPRIHWTEKPTRLTRSRCRLQINPATPSVIPGSVRSQSPFWMSMTSDPNFRWRRMSVSPKNHEPVRLYLWLLFFCFLFFLYDQFLVLKFLFFT